MIVTSREETFILLDRLILGKVLIKCFQLSREAFMTWARLKGVFIGGYTMLRSTNHAVRAMQRLLDSHFCKLTIVEDLWFKKISQNSGISSAWPENHSLVEKSNTNSLTHYMC